jgi:hypothetical protein
MQTHDQRNPDLRRAFAHVVDHVARRFDPAQNPADDLEHLGDVHGDAVGLANAGLVKLPRARRTPLKVLSELVSLISRWTRGPEA